MPGLLHTRTACAAAITTVTLVVFLASTVFGAENVVPTSAGVAQGAPEYVLKAAFIYNFARFITWAPRRDGLLTLCVLGRDPFGIALDALDGKDIAGARIAILRLRRVEDVLSHCQIVFITDSEVEPFISFAASGVSQSGLLTIAEREGAARMGIMVELTLEGRKLGFELNQKSAERSGLAISSKLLRLASKVY